MNNKVLDNTIIMGIDPGTNITGYGLIKIINHLKENLILFLNKLSTTKITIFL